MDCRHDFYEFTDTRAARAKCGEMKEQTLSAKIRELEKLGQREDQEQRREKRELKQRALQELVFDENRILAWLMQPCVGRCSRDGSHHWPFWRCTSCRLVLCRRCARCTGKEQSEREELQELLGHCDKAPKSNCKWWQHPERPIPFFVIDQIKVPDEEKVAWLRQELGQAAPLPDFAAKYLELFGARKNGQANQKCAVMQLYALYAPDRQEAAWKKECDIPPEHLVAFQRVWNPKAPRRCEECSKALPERAPITQRFCSDKCKDAGLERTCKLCEGAEEPCRICQTLKAPDRASSGTRLDMACDSTSLKRFWEVAHSSCSAVPSHEPAWKKRRRS